MLILNLTKTAFGLVNIFKRIKYAARLVHTIMAVIPIARCDAMAIKFSTRKTQDVKPNANENEINFPLRSFSIWVRGRPSVRVLGVGGRKRGMERKSVGRLVGRSDAKISSSSRITQVQWGCCAFLSFYFSFFSWAAAVLLLPNDICWRCEGRHAIASSRQRVKLCTSVTFLPLLQLLSFTWHHFSQRSPTVAVSFSVYRFYEKRPNEFFSSNSVNVWILHRLSAMNGETVCFSGEKERTFCIEYNTQRIIFCIFGCFRVWAEQRKMGKFIHNIKRII